MRDIGSKSKFTKCPSCNSVEVESMPIAKNELYKFDVASCKNKHYSTTCCSVALNTNTTSPSSSKLSIII